VKKESMFNTWCAIKHLNSHDVSNSLFEYRVEDLNASYDNAYVMNLN